MILRPTRAPRTDLLFSYPRLFRAGAGVLAGFLTAVRPRDSGLGIGDSEQQAHRFCFLHSPIPNPHSLPLRYPSPRATARRHHGHAIDAAPRSEEHTSEIQSLMSN